MIAWWLVLTIISTRFMGKGNKHGRSCFFFFLLNLNIKNKTEERICLGFVRYSHTFVCMLLFLGYVCLIFIVLLSKEEEEDRKNSKSNPPAFFSSSVNVLGGLFCSVLFYSFWLRRDGANEKDGGDTDRDSDRDAVQMYASDRVDSHGNSSSFFGLCSPSCVPTPSVCSKLKSVHSLGDLSAKILLESNNVWQVVSIYNLGNH